MGHYCVNDGMEEVLIYTQRVPVADSFISSNNFF